MQRSQVLGIAGVVIATLLVVSIVLVRTGHQSASKVSSPPTGAASGSAVAGPRLDPLVEEFRATERACIQRFNDALRNQRENSIDELELSNTIEQEVLTPWRELRVKVAAAPSQDELYTTLRKYIEARQISWEAYVTALRAPNDDAARPHYETHRAQNAIAQEHARHLGQLFRAATSP